MFRRRRNVCSLSLLDSQRYGPKIAAVGPMGVARDGVREVAGSSISIVYTLLRGAFR